MILLAFHGPGGAGKSTCAEQLVAHYGFKRLSFAAPLYRMLDAAGFGWPKTQEEKLQPVAALQRVGINVTWRHAAQTLGTEWGRECIDPNVWALLALAQAEDINGRYVFDDLRFPNEGKLLREAGGTVVHLIGRKTDMGVSEQHASERPLPFEEGDYRLDNTENSLPLLRAKLEDLIYAVVSG